MADYNTNYQTYSGALPSGNFNYGQLQQLDSSMGLSAGNQPTFIKDGNIYQVKDNGNNTFGIQSIDTVANRQAGQAQQLYQQQQGSAISTLQSAKSDLAGQYGSLLNTVTGQYQPLINQATLQQNAQNASRGLVSNIGNGGTQMISALNPVYSAEAANTQQLGAGSISDMNAYANAISAAQSGLATGNATLPLEYGSLALSQQALPASISQSLAQANLFNQQATSAPYVNTGLNGITFNAGNNTAQLLGQKLNLSPEIIQKVLASLG